MRHIVVAALLCGFAYSAQAEGAALRPFVGLGYTSGGETLLPVTVSPQGSSTQYKEDISAGAGVEGRVGLSFRLSEAPVSIRASYGIHNDQANGITNERIFFRRYPVELIGYYHFTDRASVGIGVRRATRPALRLKNAQLTTTGGTKVSGVNAVVDFESSTGVVLEGEWLLTPNWGIGVRYVREHFTYDGVERVRVNADHIGVNTQWYFR
ncbi:hypothetical protein [uncultured Aquabacterium sp.]|uniref:hypothetical protein n=1 Tax=Aquabacterium sp. TaxID=1872578 RepID=UPI0025D85052|nr:hypothetical protein [uncultured Aquabacterium sp.]